MKKNWILFLFFVLFSYNAYSYSIGLKEGTYSLSGGTHKWGSSGYEGEVVIYPNGDHYNLIWRIGNNQSQLGVGILKDGILSVAFVDQKDPDFWGVVSYKVGFFGDTLEGTWVSYKGSNSKPEFLSWKNSFTY